MKIYTHQHFDEIQLGRINFQFFSVALWQPGFVKTFVTPYVWAIACPFFSIKVARGGDRQ